jgi:hypothetical protein
MQVVKLAQPGYDARTAGDENLIYSSLWPLFKIYRQGSAIVDDVSASQVLTTHDLSFVPVFWYFSNATINAWSASGTLATEERSEFFGATGGGTLSMSDSRLSFSPTVGTASGSLRLYYYIFALDITKQYIAPSIKVGDISGARGKRVLKLAKPGKDVTSKNLEDFTIHSNARSPLIHSVNPSAGVVKEFTVNHDLGYLPMFFGYSRNADGSYSPIPTGQGGASSFQSTEQTVTFANSGGKEVTIVVLKDPFLIDYSVQVNI